LLERNIRGAAQALALLQCWMDDARKRARALPFEGGISIVMEWGVIRGVEKFNLSP
jgi:hypothetical protein